MRREAAPSRIPAGGDDGNERLSASIATLSDRLQSAMQQVASTSSAGERASDRVHAAGKSPLAEIDALTDLSMPAMERVSDEWREAHFLWTVPQVIDRYGMPTNVFGGAGQITLEYLRPRPGGPRMLVDFVAYDGFVTSVRVTH